MKHGTMTKPEPNILHTTARARELAREVADRYFVALAAEIPFDNAPGDVDLIRAVTEIHDAILQDSAPSEHQDEHREGTALQAGYLLGVEIGRRMAGGVR